MSDARAQETYQVRFDWGAAGAVAIAPDADVLVWVDELGASEPPAGAAPVIAGTLREADAVARWVRARQEAHGGGRFRVAVVAAGEPDGDGLRFAVEDLFAAGAVIDAIADLGIDHQSPEAAAAASAHRGLRGGMRHLVSASVTARATGAGVDLTPIDAVRVLRD